MAEEAVEDEVEEVEEVKKVLEEVVAEEVELEEVEEVLTWRVGSDVAEKREFSGRGGGALKGSGDGRVSIDITQFL